jgi:hypothetical protein
MGGGDSVRKINKINNRIERKQIHKQYTVVIRYFIAAHELTWNILVVARHWEIKNRTLLENFNLITLVRNFGLVIVVVTVSHRSCGKQKGS